MEPRNDLMKGRGNRSGWHHPEAPPAAHDNLGDTTSQINLPRTSRRAAGAISGALGAALGQFYSYLVTTIGLVVKLLH